ncbi:unnamed protein product, partial [Thlaspi arvense]
MLNILWMKFSYACIATTCKHDENIIILLLKTIGRRVTTYDIVELFNVDDMMLLEMVRRQLRIYLVPKHTLDFVMTGSLAVLVKLSETTDLFLTNLLHTLILKLGFATDTFTANLLINKYVKLREINTARKVFDEMCEPNVVSWTSVISGYNDTSQPQTALSMFQEMHKARSVSPNEFTFASVFKACSALAESRIGKNIHARLEVSGLRSNTVMSSSLLDMY